MVTKNISIIMKIVLAFVLIEAPLYAKNNGNIALMTQRHAQRHARPNVLRDTAYLKNTASLKNTNQRAFRKPVFKKPIQHLSTQTKKSMVQQQPVVLPVNTKAKVETQIDTTHQESTPVEPALKNELSNAVPPVVADNNAQKDEVDNKISKNENAQKSLTSFIQKNKIKKHDPYGKAVISDIDSSMSNSDIDLSNKKEKYKKAKEPVNLFQRRLDEFNASQKEYVNQHEHMHTHFVDDKDDYVDLPLYPTKHMHFVDYEDEYVDEINSAPESDAHKTASEPFQFGQMVANGMNAVNGFFGGNEKKNEIHVVEDTAVEEDRLDNIVDQPVQVKNNNEQPPVQCGQMIANGTNAITNGLSTAWKYGKDGMWYLWNGSLWKPMELFSTKQYEKDPVAEEQISVIKSKLRIYFEQYICKEKMNYIAPVMRLGTCLLVMMLWCNPAMFSVQMSESTLMLWVAKLGLSTVQIISGESPAVALGTIGLSKFAGFLVPYIGSWFGVSKAASAISNIPVAAIKTEKMSWGAWAFGWLKSVTSWGSLGSTLWGYTIKKVDGNQQPKSPVESPAMKKLFSELSPDIQKKFIVITNGDSKGLCTEKDLDQLFEQASEVDQAKLLQIMAQSKILQKN